MTRREELEEAYEDAYFELLMDEVAEMEGAYWEEVRKELENDPTAAMPESVERRCVQTIKRCFARQRRQKNLRIAKRVLNRIAVFVAIVSMMITTVLAVSEDARVAAANLLITVNERYTEMHMDPNGVVYSMNDISADEVLEDDYFSQFKVGWIPEGFSYYSGTSDMDATFINNDGLLISIEYVPGSATYRIDTEDADSIDTIKVDGHSVMKVLKDGSTNMVLINEEKHCFVSVLTSQEISWNIALRILENILFI